MKYVAHFILFFEMHLYLPLYKKPLKITERSVYAHILE